MLVVLMILIVNLLLAFMNTNRLISISTGNCSYANNVELNFVCEGALSSTIRERWSDRRLSVNTRYAVWESSKEKNAVVLVSFRPSQLFDYKTIKVESLHYKLFGVEDGESVEVKFDADSLNCFSYGLRYVSDLKNHCLDLDYNPDDIVTLPILHYSKAEYPPK
ncbi:hypothetical protein KR093_002145 [Drosophila rubida]|uniref:Uncharacterized protein n=1 Tax=Drosophila rubida TaxID=30044 RepID=A0AAD4JY47_9MUSC|nr:hypothetical protein KR093_002145 [Drosophila rubida]